MENTFSTPSTEKESSPKKVQEAMPHEGELGFPVFQDAIENDRKEVIIGSYYKEHGFPETRKELDQLLEIYFSGFSMRFKGLREVTDDPSPVWGDVAFMEKYTKALFATFYTKEPFLSAFPDTAVKERYFELLKKYLYTKSYDAVMVDAAKAYPREKKDGLTTREKDALIMDDKEYEAKYGKDE